MTALTLAAANAIIEAAFAKSVELKLRPLGVSVLDAGGHLVAFQRQDGASLLRPQMSAGKAFGSGWPLSAPKRGTCSSAPARWLRSRAISCIPL